MTPDVDSLTVAELRRLARSRPRSGRHAAAKISALRALERLERQGTRRRAKVPPCPRDWHPQGGEWEQIDLLYLEQHPQVRARWWRAWHVDRARADD